MSAVTGQHAASANDVTVCCLTSLIRARDSQGFSFFLLFLNAYQFSSDMSDVFPTFFLVTRRLCSYSNL